jgi:hypothetical protein
MGYAGMSLGASWDTPGRPVLGLWEAYLTPWEAYLTPWEAYLTPLGGLQGGQMYHFKL